MCKLYHSVPYVIAPEQRPQTVRCKLCCLGKLWFGKRSANFVFKTVALESLTQALFAEALPWEAYASFDMWSFAFGSFASEGFALVLRVFPTRSQPEASQNRTRNPIGSQPESNQKPTRNPTRSQKPSTTQPEPNQKPRRTQAEANWESNQEYNHHATSTQPEPKQSPFRTQPEPRAPARGFGRPWLFPSSGKVGPPPIQPRALLCCSCSPWQV